MVKQKLFRGNLGWDYYYAMVFKRMLSKENNNTFETDVFIELITDSNERDKVTSIIKH